MKVSSFKVSLGYSDGTAIDITDTVLNINVEESLFGSLTGRVEVVDGTGMLDNAIDVKTNVILEFEYLKHKVIQVFYLDGVTDIDVTTSLVKKTYAMNLKSVDSLANAAQLVSKSFKGRSTDIIKTIFDNAFSSKLLVLADSITKGHYISPNISPLTAINQIQKQAYDINFNPFFMFNRLVDNKHTFLTSLSQIEGQTEAATISTQIQDYESVSKKTLSNIGQPSQLVIHSTGANQLGMTHAGVFGKNVVNLDISNSMITNEQYGVTTNSTSKLNLVRPDMFDDASPLLNTNDHVNICKMQSILKLMFNMRVTAYGCQAIPNIGVGNKVQLNVRKNTQSQGVSAKFSGKYIISKIIHRIADNEYTQTIEMARG